MARHVTVELEVPERTQVVAAVAMERSDPAALRDNLNVGVHANGPLLEPAKTNVGSQLRGKVVVVWSVEASGGLRVPASVHVE